MNDVLKILQIIFDSITNLWPYLLITIPLSVAVNLSGAAKHINRVMKKNPTASILLATLVGAFSPFCSCGVIPLIASMLIGGVPLAPIMSFWIASPSMDVEAFFLSVAALGWNLAIWRLFATLTLSLGAGFLTHILMSREWFGENILVQRKQTNIMNSLTFIKGWYPRITQQIISSLKYIKNGFFYKCCPVNELEFEEFKSIAKINLPDRCCNKTEIETNYRQQSSCECSSDIVTAQHDMTAYGGNEQQISLSVNILKETWNASYMVLKFMTLAFFIKAIVTLYVPDEVIIAFIGQENMFSVLISTLIGIPLYTSNLTALPMMGSLIEQGMDKGAALAFLIAGPITTLPAMAAVWGLVNRKVFIFYLAVPLLGAILFGYLFDLM